MTMDATNSSVQVLHFCYNFFWRNLFSMILQDRVIDKLFKKKEKNQPIATGLFVVISYDIFHKTFEAISYCHKVIFFNKEVIASTCLLQYLRFIATRFFCCINLLPQSLLQRLATTFSSLQ